MLMKMKLKLKYLSGIPIYLKSFLIFICCKFDVSISGPFVNQFSLII